MSRGLLGAAALNVAIAAGYFVAGKLGLKLAFVNASASAVWPPTGLALVATLLLGSRIAPGILCGAFLVNWSTTGGVGSSAMIACGNTLEALSGAWLANRFAAGARSLVRAQDVIRFIFFAAVPSTAISATCGVATLLLARLAQPQDAGIIWMTWWLGDFVSNLTIAPLLLVWLGEPLPRWVRRQWISGALYLVLVLAGGWIIFIQGITPVAHHRSAVGYLALPLLLWGALQFRRKGAATVAAILSAVALYGTLSGSGPFATDDSNRSLLLLQGFMGVTTITAVVVASLTCEREELLEREQAARATAEALSRSKDQFLAVLSHELRTPLTPVLLLSDLLLREHGKNLPAEVCDDLRAIARNVKLEVRLIDDLLDVTRIERGKLVLAPEDADVHALIRNAVQISATDRSAEVRLELNASRHHVRCDAARITQVFWNLLTNARKFTDPDGRIDVWSCDVEGDAPRIRVGVTDSGAGIEPELLPKIFLPFEQGPSARTRPNSGLGLGLAISKSLIEAHGGTLVAQSEGPGRGATFLVELPALPLSAPARAPMPEPELQSKPDTQTAPPAASIS